MQEFKRLERMRKLTLLFFLWHGTHATAVMLFLFGSEWRICKGSLSRALVPDVELESSVAVGVGKRARGGSADDGSPMSFRGRHNMRCGGCGYCLEAHA